MHGNNLHPILKEILNITSQNPDECYQCGKCSAGCPVRDFVESPPNRIVRFVQLGMYDKALNSDTIWLCASCMSCSSRCPQNFELTKFMDALREIAIKKGIKPSQKNIAKFHKAFLEQIKNHGRSYELGLVRDYKLSSGDLFQDIDVAPEMFLKGKISVKPHNTKGKEKIKKIIIKATGGEQ
jgi:heterodisulfide reductase subunit C